MNNEIWIALIGVGGTLLGTVLGWALNSISKRGKLNIYVKKVENFFDGFEEGHTIYADSINETSKIKLDVLLEMYNCSAETKIMRDVNFEYYDENHNCLFITSAFECLIDKKIGYITQIQKLDPVNIIAKNSKQLCVGTSIEKPSKNIDLFWKTKKIYLTYKDEKNKTKKILIKKEDYQNYFENHKLEEQDGQA